ncbi:MAG: ATP-dependent DNA helicase RecG [Gammaproteobacteria bacterium]|nr:ATP-dependent DNA helicase RecG [Gammaproteobacteria bacterium]
MSTDDLEALPVTSLKGVGSRVAVKLEGLGLRTVQDVLFHLPFRYQDRTRLRPIGSLRAGEEAVIEVEVDASDVVIRRRRSLLCKVSDGTGSLTLRFFHFSQAQANNLARGVRLQCFSEVRRGPAGLEMVHPEYTVIKAPGSLEQSLTPIYSTTEGVHQLTLRKLTDQALALLDKPGAVVDWLPVELVNAAGYPSLRDALKTVHRPSPDEDISALMDGLHPAHRRLAFEELIAHRLGLRQLRAAVQQHFAPPIDPAGELYRSLLGSLAFSLTGAQQRVLEEIRVDMRDPQPMLRLVQGDVGSGKTIVAAAAAALVVESGFQVAIMAPTEILAEQHLLNFSDWFESLGIDVGWLSGKLTARARRDAIEAVATGRHRVVVGTHALFQDDVEFENLGLAVIDEQHRFGVHQRMALRNKGAKNNVLPHQLIMTATPIPRTLAMTAYADLECSVIDELPPGRKPVTTVAVESGRRGEVVERIATALKEGRQAYWVCTLIEESESLQAEAAEDTAQLLQETMPDFRIGLVHGRLKSREKESIMQAFKEREIDLLVATTVIEVGVDVPNASLMVIENAERLGLSQLHQLRGRVGRGEASSTCILVYHSPLSENARERISIMRETNDGFVVAQKDLDIRGAGEVLGTRQTGLAEFRIAELSRDADLLDAVSETADRLSEFQPECVKPLIRRWIGEQKKDYGGV